MTRYAPLLLALIAPLLMSMSKKADYSITFHSQGDPNDMSKTMFPFELEGQRLLFKIVPEMSQQNIVSFHSFPAENGNKNGVAFQMDFRGKAALEIATRSRRGEYLLAMVNGLPVDYVILDEVITDGFITIWQGVPDDVVKKLDKKFARIKSSGPLSSSDKFDDMAPTTKKEKKRALEASKEAEKAAKKAEKDAKSGKKSKEVPSPANTVIPKLSANPAASPSLPSAPVTSSIPVEGAAAPAAPAPPQAPPQTRGTPLPPSELDLPKKP